MSWIDGLDDPTIDWDCAPPKDGDGKSTISEWMREYVKQHVSSEANSLSWNEREKNSRALRARFFNDA